MKYFDWDEGKNQQLKTERNISFEDVQVAVEEEKLIEAIEHPNKKKYPNQKVFVVEINNYIYMVPYVEDDTKYFLKTIFPSRKMTKKYIIERREK